MTAKIKQIADLVLDPGHESETLELIALENVASGTGMIDSDTELASMSGGAPGVAKVLPGDVLFGRLRPYLEKSLLMDRAALASTELLALRPKPGTYSRWFEYVVRSRPFVDWAVATSYGSKMPRTSWESIREFELEVLNLAEQRATADFLDAETARIDALILKKLNMMKLLEDRWAAQVRSTITGSGKRWIPLRRRWLVIDCKHRTPSYAEDGFPVVSPGDTTPGILDLSRCHRFVTAKDLLDLTEGERRPRRGDIVYSRNASIGIASFVNTNTPFCMGQDVCLIRSDDQDQRFLTYALNTLGVEQLDRMKIGSTFSRINIAQIAGIEIPDVSPLSQRDVADRLDRESLVYEDLKSRFTDQVALLKEHRQALITAAVTGQLAIPGAA